MGEIPGGQAGNQSGHAKQPHRQSDLGTADMVFLVGKQGEHGRYCAHTDTGNEDGQAEEYYATMLYDRLFNLLGNQPETLSALPGGAISLFDRSPGKTSLTRRSR